MNYSRNQKIQYFLKKSCESPKTVQSRHLKRSLQKMAMQNQLA